MRGFESPLCHQGHLDADKHPESLGRFPHLEIGVCIYIYLSGEGGGAHKIIFFYIFLVLLITPETHALVKMSNTAAINLESKRKCLLISLYLLCTENHYYVLLFQIFPSIHASLLIKMGSYSNSILLQFFKS